MWSIPIVPGHSGLGRGILTKFIMPLCLTINLKEEREKMVRGREKEKGGREGGREEYGEE